MPLSAIHPAFLRWLDANHARFALGVEIGPRSDGALEFAFAGITHAIGGVLTDSEIEVAATYEGVRWDILVDFEAQPRRVRGGAVCALCPPEARTLFADRESLWADHLFEPLLGWVNSDLAEADRLALCGSPGYATWARLLPLSPDPSPANGRGEQSKLLRGGGLTLDYSMWVEGALPPVQPEVRRILLPRRHA